MPQQVEYDVHKSAVIVMNAGAGERKCAHVGWQGSDVISASVGMGLSLSLALAEEGYKVLGLVHENLASTEAGSLGRVSKNHI